MVFKDGEGDELVLVLELLLVDDFVKQFCDMFRRILEGTATESTEHDAVGILHQWCSLSLPGSLWSDPAGNHRYHTV